MSSVWQCLAAGPEFPPVAAFLSPSSFAPSEQLPRNRFSTGIPRAFRTAAAFLTNVATLRGTAVDSSGFRPGILDSFA